RSISLVSLSLHDALPISIALGFVLRMLGGCYAVDEIPTTWITLCTFFLALFLGFAKRRAELGESLTASNSQRPVLAEYSVAYLRSEEHTSELQSRVDLVC